MGLSGIDLILSRELPEIPASRDLPAEEIAAHFDIFSETDHAEVLELENSDGPPVEYNHIVGSGGDTADVSDGSRADTFSTACEAATQTEYYARIDA